IGTLLAELIKASSRQQWLREQAEHTTVLTDRRYQRRKHLQCRRHPHKTFAAGNKCSYRST
ncbi:MAG: hypothetical protein AAGD43_20855, partial [Pseudomonadota bacterium]